MNPMVVLDIIKLILEITLEAMRGMPLDQRQKMWADHAKLIAFWQDLFARLAPQVPQGVK